MDETHAMERKTSGQKKNKAASENEKNTKGDKKE